jgi:hypothetical protein
VDSSILAVQELLEETARECLRYSANHELTPAQYQKLAQFIFGCMNQRMTLPERVKKHGSVELAKVRKFIAAAAEVLLEFDAGHGK